MNAEAFTEALIAWHRENLRDLPWRKTDENGNRDPYSVWVSEIMLQQTRIETVKAYFERFMQAFPTVKELADAPEEEVLKLWEGLGYYSRARNLHKAAKKIAERKSFPDSYEEILALPGVGEYTAGAIASMAFRIPQPAVDGNVLRVMSRVCLLEENVLTDSAKKRVTAILKEIYPAKTPGDMTEGLMELGEVICLPQEPRCETCPVKEFCLAKENGKEKELPIRQKTLKRTVEEREVYLVKDEQGRLLLFKRPEKGVLRGLWELPNVLKSQSTTNFFKSKDSENPSEFKDPSDSKDSKDPSEFKDPSNSEDSKDSKESLESLKKYGVSFVKGRMLSRKKHVFSHITWEMTTFEAVIGEGEIVGGVFADPEELMLPTAFKKLLQK